MLSILPEYLVPGEKDVLTWDDRAEKVKEAFLHAYHGYEKYAAPGDELRPLSNTRADELVPRP